MFPLIVRVFSLTVRASGGHRAVSDASVIHGVMHEAGDAISCLAVGLHNLTHITERVSPGSSWNGMPRRADLSAPAGFVRDRKIIMRRGYLLTSHHDSRTESAIRAVKQFSCCRVP